MNYYERTQERASETSIYSRSGPESHGVYHGARRCKENLEDIRSCESEACQESDAETQS